MKDSYVSMFNQWFTDNGIINDHVINNLVMYVMSFHKSIKDVHIFVPKGEKSVGFLVYLSRWDYFFKSKMLYEELKGALNEYLRLYKVDIGFKVYKGEKNGSDKDSYRL